MSENTAKGLPITLSAYPKAILHIDCDAFFTSCEAAVKPSLKGKPLITGKERGIASCASYEAKAKGVKRGMMLKDVRKVCPDCIILPSDYETYSLYSERVFSIIRRFSPEVEEYSIDEAFCDITGLRRIYRCSYEEIALKIKRAIEKELDITVSIGLSLSKSLAKICSKENKPSGFMPLPGRKLHIFLKKVPLERVCGFGPSSVALLTKYGIKNVYDFINKPLSFAEGLLGKVGRELYLELRGAVVYEINTKIDDKQLSLSKTKTFTPPSADKDFVKAQLMRNLESAFIKLRRHRLSAGKLAVYLRRKDFSSRALEAKFNRHSSATLDFTPVTAKLFEMVYERGTLYRSTGIILSDLVAAGVDERDLFDDEIKVEKLKRISGVIDKVNYLYGKHSLHVASTEFLKHRLEKPTERNTLAQRKKELLKGETFRQRLNIPLLRLK